MKRNDRIAEKLETFFEEFLIFAIQEEDPIVWQALVRWCKSPRGGRSKFLGRRTDNAWCFDRLPHHVRTNYSSLSSHAAV